MCCGSWEGQADMPDPELSSSATRNSPTVAGEIERMLLTGRPLVEGLQALAGESVSGRDRRQLQRLAAAIESGEPFESAVTRLRLVHPELGAVLAAGLQHGNLPQLFSEYLGQARGQAQQRQAFWMACLYPLLVLSGVILVSLIYPLYIIPQLKQLFIDFGISLPFTTLLLLGLSDFLWWTWPVWLAVGGAIVTLFIFHESLPGVGFRQAVVRWTPGFGAAQQLQSLSELCSQLGLLIRSRLPLPDMLDVLSSSLQSRRLRRASRQLRERLARGESLQDCQYGLNTFPADVIHLLDHVQQPDEVADQLRLAAQAYALQAQLKLRQCLLLIEPLFLITIGCGLGFVCIASFAPLMSLLNDLS